MTSSHTAQGLASLGRNGDSMLMHVNPDELRGLQGLAMSQGGSLSINPHTGLPEAFKLGNFFKSLLPTIAGFAASGMSGGAMSPMLAGILAGSATGAATSKDPLLGAITGGLGGYGGANLFSAANAFTPAISGATGLSPGAVGAVGTTGQMGGGNLIGSGVVGSTSSNALPVGFNQAVAQSGSTVDQALLDPLVKQQISMYTPSATARQTAALGGNEAKFGALIDNATPAATQYSPNFEPIPGATQGFGGAPANTLSQAYKNVAADPLGFIGQNKMAVGLPIGGALLGGLEPSDIYGKPINMDEAKKKQAYDPYARLNLSGDTGLRLYADGGSIQSSGIRDLYGGPDNQPTMSSGLGGFGLGRLNDLANEQARTQAQTYGYAMGGPVSFADGGDSNKEDALGLPSLSPDMSMDPNVGADNSAMAQNIMGAMQGNAPMTQGQMPDQTNDSLIAKVTSNLRADPNYQPTNPIEASIVNQIKGNDSMQEGQPSLQGLGSLTPNQPMTPSYNPSQAMSPTYFAGINAPRGYAEGGETSLNLDRLPSLNVNTGEQSYNSPYDTLRGGLANSSDPKGQLLNRLFSFRPGGNQSIYDQFSTQMAAQQAQGRAKGGYLDGQGDGMSDSIPATIEGKQPARLADGEFVVPADVVSHLGNGSSKAGSKRLYSMLDKIRKARTGHTKQGKQINPNKYMPA